MGAIDETGRAGSFIQQAGLKRCAAETGAVTLTQRFGSAANLNIHLRCLVLAGAADKATMDKQYKEFKASQIEWQDAPSVGKGARIAMLEGDLKSPGPFTFRLKVPPNTKADVHTHPTEERVTVLKGDFYFATGTEFDPRKATKYKAGDTLIVPKDVPMYAFTKRNEVIVQINGNGPWGIEYLKTKDRKSNAAALQRGSDIRIVTRLSGPL